MRALLVTFALLAVPSVASAHTGAVFKTAISFVPMLLNRCYKLFCKIISWIKHE